MHLTTQKSSGDKCTQRAGISVPRVFTTKAHSQRQREQTNRSPKRRKEVKGSTQSKWKHEASRTTKQVKKKGQSKWKNEMKASGKMRRSKRSRPSPAKRQAKSKTSEIQRRKLPKDASVIKDHQKSTGSSYVYRTTGAINNRFESKSSTEQRTSKGGMTV